VAAARSSRVGAGAVFFIVLIVTFAALSRGDFGSNPAPLGSGCLVRDRTFAVPLSPGQAAIAATIAGVARHRSLPVRAVTIAYATAIQESGLADLPYGDRDSVGVFQQRPSQGWGTRQQLLDPVYATSRFFAALTRVAGYQHMLIYQAAQAVQHSADGQAYSQYAPQGATMAAGFTGHVAHSVWCWYDSSIRGRGHLVAASAQLRRAFGRLAVSNTSDPTMRVRVGRPAAGWSVATWLVTHASLYRISVIRYDGYQWAAASAKRGWTPDPRRGHRQPGAFAVTFR
jgi:hypothetical protein